MADACVLGFSHILLFHNKSFACRPDRQPWWRERGKRKGEREKKGRNDWRDKEGRGGRGEVYDLTNLSGEDTPLIFVYILASFMEILGKVEKLASSIFSREKLRARELSWNFSRGAPVVLSGIARFMERKMRANPLPPSSSLLILAARRWFIGSTGSWLGLGTFLSSMNRDMLDCFPRFRWYVFGISVEEISYDMINRIVRFSFTLLIDKRNEKLCYLFN